MSVTSAVIGVDLHTHADRRIASSIIVRYQEFGNCVFGITSDSRRLPRIHAAVCAFQVWISYAQFELSVDGSDNVKRATDVYQQANKTFKQANEKEERLMLLDSWKEFEVHTIYCFVCQSVFLNVGHKYAAVLV